MKILDLQMFFGSSLFGKSVSSKEMSTWLASYPHLEAMLIPHKPYDYHYAQANQEVEEFASQNKAFRPVLRVDPWRQEEALALIQKTKSPLLFLHPFEEQFYPTQTEVKNILEEAFSRQMKVILACGYLPFSHSAQVYPLIRDFPQGEFILTHGAQINVCGMHMEEAFEIFADFSNTYFETSGIYREDYIEKAINELGSQRVLFGSGSPYYHFPFELKRIEHLNCSDEVKEKILWKNASALFA